MTIPLYLSTVAAASTRERVDWADFGSLHRFVMTRFGDLGTGGSPRAAGGVLFRAEVANRQRRLLIQSTAQPIGVDHCLNISPTLSMLQPGGTCRMRIDINPVQRIARSGADRALPESEVPEWLANKLNGALTLDQIIDLRTDVRRVNRKKIVVAEVEATVIVADPLTTRRLVESGVGRRKSHGCGLLSLLPISQT